MVITNNVLSCHAQAHVRPCQISETSSSSRHLTRHIICRTAVIAIFLSLNRQIRSERNRQRSAPATDVRASRWVIWSTSASVTTLIHRLRSIDSRRKCYVKTWTLHAQTLCECRETKLSNHAFARCSLSSDVCWTRRKCNNALHSVQATPGNASSAGSERHQAQDRRETGRRARQSVLQGNYAVLAVSTDVH